MEGKCLRKVKKTLTKFELVEMISVWGQTHLGFTERLTDEEDEEESQGDLSPHLAPPGLGFAAQVKKFVETEVVSLRVGVGRVQGETPGDLTALPKGGREGVSLHRRPPRADSVTRRRVKIGIYFFAAKVERGVRMTGGGGRGRLNGPPLFSGLIFPCAGSRDVPAHTCPTFFFRGAAA